MEEEPPVARGFGGPQRGRSPRGQDPCAVWWENKLQRSITAVELHRFLPSGHRPSRPLDDAPPFQAGGARPAPGGPGGAPSGETPSPPYQRQERRPPAGHAPKQVRATSVVFSFGF